MSAYSDLTKMETSRNCLRRLARHDEPQFSKDSIVNVMERFVKTVNVMDDTILVPCRLMDRQIGDSTDIIAPSGKDATSNQHSVNGRRNTKNSKNVHEFLSSSELFNLYNMLNALKNDLLWTGKDENDDDDEDEDQKIQSISSLSDLQIESSDLKTDLMPTSASAAAVLTTTTTDNSTTTTGTTVTRKGHNRCPSTASVASTASVSAISDSESEISNENDSGVESESNKNGSTGGGSSCSTSSNSSVEDLKLSKKNGGLDKATELAKRTRRHLNGLYKCLEQMTEAASYLTARYQSDIGPV